MHLVSVAIHTHTQDASYILEFPDQKDREIFIQVVAFPVLHFPSFDFVKVMMSHFYDTLLYGNHDKLADEMTRKMHMIMQKPFATMPFFLSFQGCLFHLLQDPA